MSYFPYFKTIGINLQQEESTLGLERFVLGKLGGNLFKIQQLTKKEIVQLEFLLI